MPEADFLAWWKLGYILGVAVVLVVAALLIAILLVARKISSLADTALGIAGSIEARTRPIWSLGDANRLIVDLATTVRQIEADATRIADALSTAAGGGTAEVRP